MRKRMALMIAMMLLAVCCLQPCAASAEEYDKDMLVTVMPHAHIDTAWYWPQNSTVTYVYSTFYNTIKLIADNPDYVFNSSNSKHIMFMEEYYPDLFEEIVKAEADEQWEYDSGWVESDLLLISAESLARCYMYAQRYFKETFGDYSRVVCLPDNFGMGWNFPQFMEQMNYDFFVSTRVSALGGYENTPGGMMGNDLFLWRGIDDTEVLFYKPSPWYAASAPLQDVKDAAKSMSLMGLEKGMYLSGHGDAGGGMNQDMVDEVREANEKEGYPTVQLGSMEQYYDSLTEEDLSHVTIRFDDEVYFVTTHGCYTTQALTKWYNRKSELGLARTEALSSVADYLGTLPYPGDALMDAWDKTLTNQAHGILTGEGTNVVYDDAWNDGEIALSQINVAQNAAMNALARQMDTTGAGIPIVVYNPVSQPREDVAQVALTMDESMEGVIITDSQGKEYPSQIIGRDGDTAQVLFLTEMPSMGLKVFYAQPVEKAPAYDTGLSVSESLLENAHIRVEINPTTGNVRSLIDKSNGREMIEAGSEVELLLMQDNSRTAWNVDYPDLSLSPMGIVQDNPVIEVVEQGPVRSIIRVYREKATDRADGVSTYDQEIVLYANSHRVDFENKVDWKEHDVMLKVQVPMNLDAQVATFDLSNGAIERINYNTQRWEVYGHMWADMTDESGEYGMSLMNDCKYGWDKYSNSTLRLTLLRSARDQDPEADVGVHEFTYALYPHEGDWRQGNTPLAAYNMNDPLLAVQAENGQGILGNEYSFVTVDQPNVLVMAYKISENDLAHYALGDEHEFILRLNETFGEDETQVTLTFPQELRAAYQSNMLEEHKQELAPAGNTLTVQQTDWEYKTLSLQFQPNAEKAVAGKAMTPVDLTQYFNMRGFSFDKENPGAGLDYYGNTLPAEHAKQSFYAGEVPFVMGNVQDKGVANVVDARGQEIALPEGTGAIHLAACAAGYDQRADVSFTLLYKDGTEKEIPVLLEDWTSQYGWMNGDYCAPIAATFSHWHKEGANNAERRASIFLYELDAGEGEVAAIRLPDNDAVKVFAMTAEAK